MELTVRPHHDELVERCKRGEAAGYKELYQRYSRAMFNTCYRIVNSIAEAEDVLQESFTEAFRNLHTFEYRTSFGGWLKQICINRSVNHLKKKRIDWVDIDANNTFNHAEEAVVDENEIKLKVEAVKRSIMALPDGYRTVLSLYLLEGYDHEEIAEILKVSESTSRTQYMRAKQKLLQLLKEGIWAES